MLTETGRLLAENAELRLRVAELENRLRLVLDAQAKLEKAYTSIRSALASLRERTSGLGLEILTRPGPPETWKKRGREKLEARNDES